MEYRKFMKSQQVALYIHDISVISAFWALLNLQCYLACRNRNREIKANHRDHQVCEKLLENLMNFQMIRLFGNLTCACAC